MLISEFEVLVRPVIDPDVLLVNAALNKSVIEVPAANEAQRSLQGAKLTDGSLNGYWSLTGQKPYVIIDLLQASRIERVDIIREYANTPGHVRNIKIFGSNSADFSSGVSELTMVPSNYNDGSSNVWSGYIVHPNPFRYIKVAKQDDWAMPLKEIEIYTAE